MSGLNERKDVRFLDEEEIPYGVKQTDNEPHVRAKLVDAAGNVIGSL